MDEARRVLTRLERIEQLRASGAEPRMLLEEMRALLVEGEAWVSSEGDPGNPAMSALGRLASALDGEPPPRAA